MTRLHFPIRHLAKREGLKCSIAVDSSPATTSNVACCVFRLPRHLQTHKLLWQFWGDCCFGSRAFRQAVRGGYSLSSVARASVAREVFAAACQVAVHIQSCHVATLMRLMQHSCCAGDKAL